MKALKVLVIAMGGFSAVAIVVYLFVVRIPGDRAVAEATALCAGVPVGAPLSWDLVDAAHFMKVDEIKADRTRPPADGTYLALTSGGAIARYGCELEVHEGKVREARAVELPGWR